MVRKVIQVPIDEGLLIELDNLSRKLRQARSKLIREACLHYLQEIDNAELDKIYQQGYIKNPEKIGIGEIQVATMSEFMIEEAW